MKEKEIVEIIWETAQELYPGLVTKEEVRKSMSWSLKWGDSSSIAFLISNRLNANSKTRTST